MIPAGAHIRKYDTSDMYCTDCAVTAAEDSDSDLDSERNRQASSRCRLGLIKLRLCPLPQRHHRTVIVPVRILAYCLFFFFFLKCWDFCGRPTIVQRDQCVSGREFETTKQMVVTVGCGVHGVRGTLLLVVLGHGASRRPCVDDIWHMRKSEEQDPKEKRRNGKG